jgi:hypothetical protein
MGPLLSSAGSATAPCPENIVIAIVPAVSVATVAGGKYGIVELTVVFA